MKTRKAVMEGRFYPATRQKIIGQISEIEQQQRYEVPSIETNRILGGVLPHAGHIYSGHQTVPFFQLLQKQDRYPDTFVVVHPNHSGTGPPLAIDPSDNWVNAMGRVEIDKEFATSMDLPMESRAHAREHSAEVLIPFLQYYMKDRPFAIVPVCMMDQSHHQAGEVAQRIAAAASETGRNILVLASSDFSHFMDPERGRHQDQLVLNEILARNPEGVGQAVRDHQVSVCGYGPIMALLEYAGQVTGNYRIEVLARGHSGEVVPSSEVVDYISMVVYQ